MSKRVVVYSQPGCMPCRKVKEFLSQNKIEFVDRDVAADDAALQELVGLGHMTTPVIVVDDEVIVGFDRARLESLLLGG
ncbi:MAG TPA: glutaredoxin domain-containing protein [Candidatus Dormibacteraeota bacterium]|nr:glutaredoxin domain-containing protein [Candidatus Dormibacteraeota bacterium]